MHKTGVHIVVWSLYLVSLFIILNFAIDIKTALIRTSTLAIIQIIVFYSNLIWILPHFFENKKYQITILLNLVLIICGFGFNVFTEEYTPHSIHLRLNNLSKNKHIDFELLFLNIMPLTLTLFISFILYNFKKQKVQEKREFEILSAEKQFLIQQINPHFLFNTLNNIYFLTYKTAPEGAKAIMQLSKMLDYSLYGEKTSSITLKDEIEYIKNFIALFKLKDSKIRNIKFDYSNIELSHKIAPMILIPFIENAFKHGDIESSANGFIDIEMRSLENNFIYFECTNSFETNKSKDKTKGIGIANVTRRLELLYPNKHKLTITNLKNEFKVSLKLKINV